MSEIHRIREAVFARADGRCECGCGRAIEYATGRLDHFFGRAKAPQSVENCWALSVFCDEEKTANRPSAVIWQLKFIAHSTKHDYLEPLRRAQTRVAVLKAKGFA